MANSDSEWIPQDKTLRLIRQGADRLKAHLEDYINRFDQAYADGTTFGGPSLYFHYRCIKDFHDVPLARKLKDARFAELVYGTLTSWGMHRMGDSATKLHGFEHFQQQLLSQSDDLRRLEQRKIWCLSDDDLGQVIGVVGGVLDRMRISTSDSHLVASTKVLHHILPDLIPPIDRNYTLRHFGINTLLPSQKPARAIFATLYPLFVDVARSSSDQIRRHVRLDAENWHTSFTKVMDNAIIGAGLSEVVEGAPTLITQLEILETQPATAESQMVVPRVEASTMQVSQEAYSEVTTALERYKALVENTELTDSAKQTYLLHAGNFVRWLRGDFEPGAQKARTGLR